MENPEEHVTAPAEATEQPSKLRWVLVAIVLLALAYPLLKQMLPSVSLFDARPAAQGNLLQISAQQYQAGHYKESLDAAKGWLAANPGSADAYNNMAVAYLQMKQYDDAIQAAGEALRLNPGFDLARRNMAWIVSERDKAKGGGPPPPPAKAQALLNESLGHYNAREFEACIASAKAATQVDANYAEAYNNLAACEVSLKHYDAAIAAAQQAVKLKPDFDLARNNLAWAIAEKAKK